MIRNILKGLTLGFMLFLSIAVLWYLIDTSHIKNLTVKECEHAPGHGIKALNEIVKTSWFPRKHHDLQVYSDGQCVFFKYYPKPGALYFGQEMASGIIVGAAMTTAELQQLADTISVSTDFQEMVDCLAARAKSNPAPKHEF